MDMMSEFSFKYMIGNGKTIYHARLLDSGKYLISWDTAMGKEITEYSAAGAKRSLDTGTWILVSTEQKKAEI